MSESGLKRRLADCTVSRNCTLRDVMIALENGAVEIALAVDDAGRLSGIMTDGDVRRALLNGAAIDGPIERYLQTKHRARASSRT